MTDEPDLEAARAVNDEAHPTPECCLAFERVMDAFWQAHDRPGPRPKPGKQREFRRSYKTKFKAGEQRNSYRMGGSGE